MKVIFLLLLNIFAAETQKCIIEYNKHLFCYDNKSEIEDFVTCEKDLNFKIKSSEEGSVEVEFDLALQCNFDTFDIKLKVAENVDENNCKDNLSYRWKVHSRSKYQRINDSSIVFPCNQTAKLFFPYVFSGCYQMEIEITGNIGSDIRSENLKKLFFITSSYQKDKFTKKSVIFVQNYRPADEKLFINLTLNNAFAENNIQLCFELTNDATNIAEVIWNTKCSMNENYHNGNYYICNVTTLFETKQIDCQMYKAQKNKFVVLCDIRNIKMNYYLLNVVLLNEFSRCYPSAVWDNAGCIFSFKLNISEENYMIKEDESFFFGYIVCAILFILILFILFCIASIILILIKKKTKIREDYDIWSSKNETDNHFDIFLVYAREHIIIMNTIKALKKVLEENLHNKVYDIQTLDEEEKINDPRKWLMNTFCKNKSIKTLLIETQCGALQIQHQEAEIQYKKSTYLDDLFPLAVHLLTESRQAMSYSRLFVLNFSCYKPFETFLMFNPSRRFGLPDNVIYLLKHLGNFESCLQSNAVQLFFENYQKMDVFLKYNPTYFTDILNVQINK